MALRPGRTIKGKKRPFTRVSRRKPRKSYAKGVPAPKIHMFEMGTKEDYNVIMFLISKSTAQIRSNALEAARIVAHKFLQDKLGKGYFFKILVYPHHVIREKPIATGAGADRYSQGMRLSFGKPAGVSVQIKENQKIMSLHINKKDIEIGRKTLKKAGLKIPIPVRIEIEE